jgi:hypothetical protein
MPAYTKHYEKQQAALREIFGAAIVLRQEIACQSVSSAISFPWRAHLRPNGRKPDLLRLKNLLH